MKYTLKALNDLNDELNRTNVISKDFKSLIMSYAIEVAGQAREAERQERAAEEEKIK